jgi:hypothetical protein
MSKKFEKIILYYYNNNNNTKIQKMTDYTITELFIHNQNLHELPEDLVLYNCLTHLYCHGNELTTLKYLPPNLTHLICIDNLLTSLDNLPQSITHLYCSHNCLIEFDNTNIKELPKELINLKYDEYNNCIYDNSWKKNEDEIIKIINLQRYIKLYLKIPILWKIAEYYMEKK